MIKLLTTDSSFSELISTSNEIIDIENSLSSGEYTKQSGVFDTDTINVSIGNVSTGTLNTNKLTIVKTLDDGTKESFDVITCPASIQKYISHITTSNAHEAVRDWFIDEAEDINSLENNEDNEKCVSDAFLTALDEADNVKLTQYDDLRNQIVSETYINSTNGIKSCIDTLLMTQFLDEFYPIGSVWVTNGPQNPSSLFGGTWVKLDGGYILWGAETDDVLGTTVSKNETFTLTDSNIPVHSHETTMSSSGGHTHGWGDMEVSGGFYAGGRYAQGGGGHSGVCNTWSGGNKGAPNSTSGKSPKWNFHASKGWSGVSQPNGGHGHTAVASNNGSESPSPVNLLQKYIVANFWKRIS